MSSSNHILFRSNPSSNRFIDTLSLEVANIPWDDYKPSEFQSGNIKVAVDFTMVHEFFKYDLKMYNKSQPGDKVSS